MPTLEPNQLMQMLYSVSEPRDRVVLTLLIDTGARASELAGLHWEDIKTDTIHITGKTGEREVPISEESHRLLLSLGEKQHGLVFYGKHGPLTRKGIYHIVRNSMSKAGVSGPKLGPHRLRHTFGKTYLVDGGDVRSLQVIMGHTNITTTERYASLAMDDIISKHHKFTPLRAAHAAAQESLFKAEVIEEAESIVGEINNKGEKGTANG